MERSKLAHEKILFHQDNAQAHTFAVSMAKAHELGFKFLPHPPCSPDLAPHDIFLFPNHKIWLGETDFHLMRKLLPLWMSILKALKLPTFPRVYTNWKNVQRSGVEVEGDYTEN